MTAPACPSWCAVEGEHTRHRSLTRQLAHGPYGDSTTKAYVSQGDATPVVWLESWAGGFVGDDVDQDPSDYQFPLSVGDALAVADLLVGLVGEAPTDGMSRAEALARLADARAILAEFVAAKRIRPDGVKRFSSEDQLQAVVPFKLVCQLVTALDAGTYRLPDPWGGDEDEEDG